MAAQAKNLRWKEDLQTITKKIGTSIGRSSFEHLPQVMIDSIRQIASGIEAGIESETERKGAENRKALDARAEEISTKLTERFDSNRKSHDEELDRRFSTLKGQVERKLEENSAKLAEGNRQVQQSRDAATGAHTSAQAADLSNKEARSTAKAMNEKATQLEASFSEYTSGLNTLKVKNEDGEELTGMDAFKVIVSKLKGSMNKMAKIDTIYSAMAPLFKAWTEGIEVKTPEGNKSMTLVQAMNYLVRAYADAVVKMERAAADAKSAEGIARDMLNKHTEKMHELNNRIENLASVQPAAGAASAGAGATSVPAVSPSAKQAAPQESEAAAVVPGVPDLATELEAITISKSRRTLSPPFSAPPAPNPEPERLPLPSPVPVICPVNERVSKSKTQDIPSLAPVSEPPKTAEQVALEEEPTKQSAETSLSIAESLSKRFSATEAMVSEILSRMKPKIDSAYDEAAEGLESDLKEPSFKLQGAIDGTQLEARAVSAFERLDSHLRTLSILLDSDELQEEMKRASYDLTGTTLETRLDNSFGNYTKKAKRLWDDNSFRSEPPSMTAMKTLIDEVSKPQGGDS